MQTHALAEGDVEGKKAFHRVGENLWRFGTNGKYYAFLKQGDKQFHRSLKTKDRRLAERRLSDLRAQVGILKTNEESQLSFEEVADLWMASTAHTIKPATAKRRLSCIKNLGPFFAGAAIRNITSRHCERWLTERASKIAAQTMANELNTMRPIFAYAVDHGLILANPAAKIKRRTSPGKKIVIPTREQFRNLVSTIRRSDGRLDSQEKAAPGADLVELLAYSGCRLTEGTSLKWSDVDFEKGTLTITGGDAGTKNNESRVIPMTDALRALLNKWHDERKPAESDRISTIDRAHTCLKTASRRLKYPLFSHHDFRHFFATTCIEAGVDVPTVSRWLGHKDGGALAMRVYGHLRQEHNFAAVRKVAF